MKNLNKKMSVGVLAGLLLIGGVFSQESLAYDSSIKSESESFVSSFEKEVSHKYMKMGAEVFGYKFDFIYDEENISDSIKKSEFKKEEFKKSFKDGYDFIAYLYESGMNSGIYNLYIADIYYKIKVESPIKPRPWWKRWDEFSSVVFWD